MLRLSEMMPSSVAEAVGVPPTSLSFTHRLTSASCSRGVRQERSFGRAPPKEVWKASSVLTVSQMSLTSLKTMNADVRVGVRPARMPVSITVEAVALVLNVLHDRWPCSVSVPFVKVVLLPPLLLEALLPLLPVLLPPLWNSARRRSTMDPAGSTKVASELLAPHRATASASGWPSMTSHDWEAALAQRTRAAAAQHAKSTRLPICSVLPLHAAQIAR